MKYEHLAILIRDRISKYNNREALRYKKANKWHSISWFEMGKQIDDVAISLLEFGIPEKGKVAIFSQNMPEWTIADFGIYSIRGVSVPIFATNTAEQAEYIINEAEISLVFVGEQEQYDKITSIFSKSKFLKNIIIFDDSVEKLPEIPSFYFKEFIKIGENSKNIHLLKEILNRVDINDLATLIYTSGTTGEPKGVMLNHSNFAYALEIHDIRLNVSDKDVSLSFLPLSHVFERTWVYFILHNGITNNYIREPKKVIDAMSEVKPTVMCAVPRFFEKTYNGAITALENSNKIKNRIFNWAINIGKFKIRYLLNNQKIPFGLNLEFLIADLIVLKKGRAIFGGRIRFMPCAGAALSPKIIEFFHACGINVIYGYGLTETTATVSCFKDYSFNFNTVGTIMPTIEVKISDINNEILVKGKTVMQGYFNKPNETSKVFEGEWFKTGDAGKIDENGHLIMTERIKDIIKTSGGKYIAPQYIENLLSCSPYIDQIAIIGDDCKYISALIVPTFELLKKYAIKENIVYSNNVELINNSKVIDFYSNIINNLQKPLADFQKIKKFEILPNSFSIESGELTPSLKVKRKVIAIKYKNIIDKMYQNE